MARDINPLETAGAAARAGRTAKLAPAAVPAASTFRRVNNTSIFSRIISAQRTKSAALHRTPHEYGALPLDSNNN
jgi:hypothetical protein